MNEYGEEVGEGWADRKRVLRKPKFNPNLTWAYLPGVSISLTGNNPNRNSLLDQNLSATVGTPVLFTDKSSVQMLKCIHGGKKQ